MSAVITAASAPSAAELEALLIEQIEMLAPHCDAILVSDYNYGIITPAIIKFLERIRSSFDGIIAVDSKQLAQLKTLQPTLVKPSYEQAVDLLGLPTLRHKDRLTQMESCKAQLLAGTGAKIVALTLDVDGAMIFQKGRPTARTYTQPADHANAVGAGDTYISTFTLALAAGGSTSQSAELAAHAGQVVVAEKGTTPCSRERLLAHLRQKNEGTTKRVERAELADCVEEHRRQNRRIVFTNGCFDILHAGHVQYLAQAKALGDVLIVGVNSDASVTRLKGPERPISALAERMTVLSALESVDHVVAFDEDMPLDLIRIVRPDVFVKGGDYSKSMLPEAPLVRELGGRVEIMPYVMNRSTTQIINRIRQEDGRRNGNGNGNGRAGVAHAYSVVDQKWSPSERLGDD